ncbi:MAG: HAD family hydrolase [Bacteroidales bacterium]|jgi:putative hydrolase of the HAD superfamily|nr:HAD family hydrolase [Bacteroidales bacterium]
MIKTLIFDWGDTIMRDFDEPGPMSEWENVAWIPEAEECLKTLSKHYVCIIATSASHSDTVEMKKALARLGADQYFHQFYSQKELGYAKPDPRFFKAVMKKSGALANETVMIGNLYEKDIIGAKQAGLTTVFFNEHNLKGDFPDADHIINRMNQLTKLF